MDCGAAVLRDVSCGTFSIFSTYQPHLEGLRCSHEKNLNPEKNVDLLLPAAHLVVNEVSFQDSPGLERRARRELSTASPSAHPCQPPRGAVARIWGRKGGWKSSGWWDRCMYRSVTCGHSPAPLHDASCFSCK